MKDPLRHLVESASSGDEVAVDALLERYLPGLHGFVRLRMGRALLAKESTADLVQSTCREVLQHIDRFRYDGETGFKRWLYATALRKIANRWEHYRAKKRDVGREASPPPADSGRLLDGYASFCTPSQQLEGEEEVARIEDAFDALPDDYREVILLSRMIGLAHREVATEMGRTEGAVRTLLSRALATLAAELDKQSEG